MCKETFAEFNNFSSVRIHQRPDARGHEYKDESSNVSFKSNNSRKLPTDFKDEQANSVK